MSSVPAVKAKLIDILTPALPNSQVIYGPAAGVLTDTPGILTVGRVQGSDDYDSMSLVTTAEQYTVELTASVDLMAATDQQDADEMALAYMAAAKTAIRAAGPDLGLGGALSAHPTGEFELTEQADSNGRHAAVRFFVSVYAQVS